MVRGVLFILIVLALSACKFQRAEVASDAKTQMVGMSKERVLACMGPPAQAAQAGAAEVWSYPSGGDSTTVASASGRRSIATAL